MKTTIIAEAGVNHNGSLTTALRMIDVAIEIGADIIKFQTFKAEKMVTKIATMAKYQSDNLGKADTQLNMLKRLELSESEFVRLFTYADKKGIVCISTAFDTTSIEELGRFNMPLWKIPSGEITNLPYLRMIGSFMKPILLSTGMSTLQEVEEAVHAIKGEGCQDITLLHCTTEYPAPFEEVNLNAMITMKSHFQLPVGYSDHTRGIEVPIAAVAMGATVIEKHFTLDNNMEGPDHMASLEPLEFKQMVKAIRNVELSMGDGIKKPTLSELRNMRIARKSIVANQSIREGETFTTDNISVKRPGTGMSLSLIHI